jgi:hypothetical protein
MELRLDGQHRGVEAFQMARLQYELAPVRTIDQVIGLLKARGQRLLDQQIEARIEQGSGYGVMMDSGNGDGGCVEMEVGGQQLIDCREDRDCVFGSGIRGAFGVWFDGCDERNAQTGSLQLAVDAEMVAAKGSCSGHGNAQNGLASYFAASVSGPLPSTAFRQRL